MSERFEEGEPLSPQRIPWAGGWNPENPYAPTSLPVQPTIAALVTSATENLPGQKEMDKVEATVDSAE